MKTINNYASLVKEKHALNKTIAPVETDLTDASQAYAIGQNFIYDGVLYKAKTAIAQHDALVLNTNYEAADDIVSQIAGKQDPITVDNVPTENSNNLVKSGGVYSAEANIYEVIGEMGAKNLLPNIASSGSYASSGTVTKNVNGSLTINGTFDAVTTVNIDYLNGLTDAVFDVIDLIGTDIAVTFLDTAVSGITLQVGYFNSVGTRSSLEGVSTKANITFPAGAVKGATYLRIASGTYDNVTVYPMMQLASDTDSTYQPYAKTNKQLTAENQTLTQKIGTTTTKTLAANATSIEFDVPTSGNNLIKFYSSDGSFYTALDTSVSGKVTLTFEASANARTISCQIAQA